MEKGLMAQEATPQGATSSILANAQISAVTPIKWSSVSILIFLIAYRKSKKGLEPQTFYLRDGYIDELQCHYRVFPTQWR
jgi:hypothetical protein